MSDEHKLNEIYSEQDILLTVIIDLINRGIIETFPATLQMNGVIVTGDICSGKTYFEKSIELIPSLTGIYSNFLEKIYNIQEPKEVKSVYVHMINAKILNNGSLMPSNNGMVWRGRILEVSSFSLGTLKIS